VFHHAVVLHAVLLHHAVVFLHRVLGHRFLLHAVVLAHLVLSEDGWRERKAERNERGRQAEADTGRGGHGGCPLGWFSEATSAASPTTMPRPGLLPARPQSSSLVTDS